MIQLGRGKTVGLILCVTGMLLLHTLAATAAPPGWNKVWSDEFQGSSLDTSKWEAIDWTTPHNNEKQAYHPSQVTVSDGNLALTAIVQEYGGKSYTSGKVESKWAKRHGRWEIRAKLPGTQGTWPAIWLLPDSKQFPWPTQGEIDIMENRGDQPHLTSSAYHFGPNPKNRKFEFEAQRTSRFGKLQDFHNEFHTYAVEWDDKKLRFFVDDVNYYTLHDVDVDGYLSQQTAKMEVQLNVAVGGDFVKEAQPDLNGAWPQQMLIDFVRVYERDKSPPPAVFTNGGFELENGSLKNWSTFGNKQPEVPNVQIHNEAVSDGAGALKLFGQFNNEVNHSGVQQAITVAAGDSLSATVKTFVRSADSIAGTSNQLELKFDYYRQPSGKYGSPTYISSKSLTVADGNVTNDQWHSHKLSDTAPEGAVEARVSLVFTQPKNEQGAVYVDEVTFQNLDLKLNADANGDGRVDGLDLIEWQKGLGKNDGTSVSDGDFNYDGVVNNADRAVWESQHGESGVPSAADSSKPRSSFVTASSIKSLLESGFIARLRDFRINFQGVKL